MFSIKFDLILIVWIFNLLYVKAQDYNVRDFGAVGDGITEDTHAIQTAFLSAQNSNGGRVIFDSGYTFLTGCFNFYNNVILDIRGTIMGLNVSHNYALPSLIYGKNVTNVTIMGGGVVDGQGQGWWKCPSDNDATSHCLGNVTRPTRGLIFLNQTADVVIHDIRVQNSPKYNIGLEWANHVYIHNVSVVNPSDWCWGGCTEPASYNTDGINLWRVTNVLIENSYISTGDDGIALNSDRLGPSENITIRNMTFGYSFGVSFGSTTSGGIKNVSVTYITMNGSRDGVHIKSQRGRGGLVHNITFAHFHISNTLYCIVLSMNYTYSYIPPTNISKPQYQDINIHDITCDNAVYGWWLEGLEDSEINVNLSNIRITNLLDDLAIVCKDVYGVCDNSTVLPSCPPCMSSSKCEDTSEDCMNYLGLCNNPAYHNTLCNQCRNTCNLCNSCD